MKHCSATEARNNFGEIMEKAYISGNPVIVERRKKPFVAVVPLKQSDEATLEEGIKLPSFDLGLKTSKLSRDDIYEENGR